MAITAQKNAPTNADPADEERLHEALSAVWDRLLFVEMHVRAGRVGRWADSGWSLERLSGEELGDPNMPEDTVEDMVAQCWKLMKAHREREGPHVYQFRSMVRGKAGEARHEKAVDITVSLLGIEDFGSSKDEVSMVRAQAEATTLPQMHKIYLELMRANVDLVKAVTGSPLVTGQAQIRQAELEHEVAMFDKAAEREDDQEVWSIGKQLLFAKLGIGGDGSQATTSSPDACPWAKRFSTVVGDKGARFAEIVAPDDAKSFGAVVDAACHAKSEQDFKRYFEEIRERFEKHDPESAKRVVAQLAKEVGMMQMLEFKELISEVFA